MGKFSKDVRCNKIAGPNQSTKRPSFREDRRHGTIRKLWRREQARIQRTSGLAGSCLRRVPSPDQMCLAYEKFSKAYHWSSAGGSHLPAI